MFQKFRYFDLIRSYALTRLSLCTSVILLTAIYFDWYIFGIPNKLLLFFAIFLFFIGIVNWYVKARYTKSLLVSLFEIFLWPIFLSFFLLLFQQALFEEYVWHTNSYSLFLLYTTIMLGWLILLREKFTHRVTAHQSLKRPPKIFETAILLLIILNYLFIATQNLDLLPLQNDEYLTYEAVHYITTNGLELEDFTYGADENASLKFYSRALPYSIGVAVTVKLLCGNIQSVFNLRFFSVFLGMVSLYLVFLIYRSNLTASTSLTITYLFSVFYIFIYHSRISRMYSLVLAISLALIFLFLRIKERLVNTFNQQSYEFFSRLVLSFFRKNALLISTFFLLIFIGLKTHFNVALVLYPLTLSLAFSLKNVPAKFSAAGLFLFATLMLFMSYVGIGPIDSGYFNETGDLNLNYLDELSRYYNFAALFFVFFFLPLALWKSLPYIVKLSYQISFFILIFFVVFADGIQFHDPRYFIFLFPFLLGASVYGIYALISACNIKYRYAGSLLVFLLSVLFISKMQLPGTCLDTFLTACPISDGTQVYFLDRWNYTYEDAYETIEKQFSDDVILVSRTLHNYYTDKHGIPQSKQCKLLYNFSKQQKCEWNFIADNTVIFVVYPQLIYPAYEKEDDLEYIYNYLLNHPFKETIYKSEDSKIIVYKLKPNKSLN
jgi:hypothetical protein